MARSRSERELAMLYKVSRDTVREAIRELADTGYLQRRRGRYGGTFVTDPLPLAAGLESVDERELDDVLGLRVVLEVGAARAAATQPVSDAAREELWARHRAACCAGARDYRRLDTILHLTIAEQSGIPSLVALCADNRARVNEWLDALPLLQRNVEHSNEQHEDIVSAIVAGDQAGAEYAVRTHLAGSETLIRGFLA